MAVAEVQTANFTNATSGSLGANVTAGNSVILHGTAFSESNVVISTNTPTFNGSSVSGASKLWEIQSGFIGGFTVYDVAWLLPNLAGGAASVGLTFVNATMNTATGLQATEFSGLGSSPSIDNVNSPMPSTGFSNTTAVSSGTSGATTNSADLVVGGCCDGNGGITTGASGFTNTAIIGAATVFGWDIPASTGTFTYAVTGAASGNSVAGVVAIAPSGGSSTPFVPFGTARRTAARTPALPAQRRYRQTLPVPAQLNPPYPFVEVRQKRQAYPRTLLRRDRVLNVVRPQVNPPYPFAEVRQWRQPRGFFPRRGHQVTPVPAQQTAPTGVFVPQAQRRARVAVPPRRGKVTAAHMTQAEAPPRQRQPQRPRLAAVRRRFRQLMPWPQSTAVVVNNAVSHPTVTNAVGAAGTVTAGTMSSSTVTQKTAAGPTVSGG